MGAVGYTSTVADRDYFASQRAVEEASIHDDPDLECREITDLYRTKGFSGRLLEEVVDTVTLTGTDGWERSWTRNGTYNRWATAM